MLGLHPFHAVGEKYIHAVARAAEALPLLVPVLPEPLDPEEWLERVDGLLLTGSPSNVEPHRYGAEASVPGTLHDPERDATTLAVVPRALELGVPVLGICRGLQEINVALGGSLWQAVHEVPGMLDHREDKSTPLEVQYGPAHEIHVEPGGVLAGLLPRRGDGSGPGAGAGAVRVNSVHAQGVRTLAPGLRVEARAPDGLVEAFSVERSDTFAVAVQWHPEWRVMGNEFSVALFAAFGAAARRRVARRRSA